MDDTAGLSSQSSRRNQVEKVLELPKFLKEVEYFKNKVSYHVFNEKKNDVVIYVTSNDKSEMDIEILKSIQEKEAKKKSRNIENV